MTTPTGNKGAAPSVIAGLAIVMVTTACLLLIPLAGMQLSEEVKWTLSDFLVAGGLVALIGTLYVLAARLTRRRSQRVLIGVVLAALLVATWLELAVGVFGTPFAGT